MIDWPMLRGASQTTSFPLALITFHWESMHLLDSCPTTSDAFPGNSISGVPDGVTAKNSPAMASSGAHSKVTKSRCLWLDMTSFPPELVDCDSSSDTDLRVKD